MNTLSLRHPGETRSYAQSLVLSALIHSLAIAFAVTLLSDLKLAPESEPFKWDVAGVEKPAPVQSKQAQPTPTQAETQPVERTVQHVVRQEVVREIRQVIQAASQPTQMVSRTAQPIATEQSVATPTETVAATAVEARPVAAQISGVVTRQVIADATPQGSDVEPAPSPAIEQASVKEIPVRSAPATKADYGWLSDALWRQVEQLKIYPHLARMNRWEGKVVLRAVIQEDGQLRDIEVAESSGHSVLDHDALDLMRRASPLKLKHPLGKPQVVVQVPISYKLR